MYPDLPGSQGRLLFNHIFGGKQSAGGIYILTPAGTYGCGDPLLIEPVPEFQDGFLIGRFKGGTRNGMKADQIDAASNSMQNPGQFIHVPGSIVQSPEQYIFKRNPPLSTEIP
jgi:hypothetical protein